MEEYIMIYRGDQAALATASPEVMQARTKSWMDWIGGIAAQNKLASVGNRLAPEGKVVRPQGVITDGPYTEVKESVLGYSVIKAASYEEACQIASGCPVLLGGAGTVEVRAFSPVS
ncbi:transcription initiation protein [Chitinophaga parva]|uniref:Transcription initiation protein n=1 Tax=Chitinophaga parva TaxID=2169414 RepID=A0A2T7BNZ4_9BACT|nr:YciI family protein [Chitinophaga parva]PUZ29341.1 transcription initiation protein [Chitinophaga parva]